MAAFAATRACRAAACRIAQAAFDAETVRLSRNLTRFEADSASDARDASFGQQSAEREDRPGVGPRPADDGSDPPANVVLAPFLVPEVRGCEVLRAAVGLAHDPKIGPEEVDSISPRSHVELMLLNWRRYADLDEAREAERFERRLGKPTRDAERPAESRDPVERRLPRHPLVNVVASGPTCEDEVECSNALSKRPVASEVDGSAPLRGHANASDHIDIIEIPVRARPRESGAR